tara:strand:+ start:3181 stop:4080 length:900 start_codon:yes stop_codon:yes gene_type:complete
MHETYTVEKDFHNSRFDRWFKAKVKDLPQSLIEKIIRQNKVKLNNKKVKSAYRLQEGDVINVYNISKFIDNTKNRILKYKPSKKEINTYDDYIIENNKNFVVINKPAGIPVQGGTSSFKNIIDIINDTKYFENYKPYIVHRLDKETSGILIIAKNREYAQLFTSLFRIRKIHKTYLALTYGKVSNSIKTLKDNLIYYDNKKKIEQKAITHLKVLKSTDDFSFLELNPITGRKHQLRKQLYNIGNPIIGDKKYFKNIKYLKKFNKLMLHSFKIKFMINNIKYNFKANYSLEFKSFINSKF